MDNLDDFLSEATVKRAKLLFEEGYCDLSTKQVDALDGIFERYNKYGMDARISEGMANLIEKVAQGFYGDEGDQS
jgi:hypothetical protein